MQRRKLGTDLQVSAIGYGAMVLVGLYGDVDEEQGVRTIRHAIDAGINFIDTSDAYGVDGSNERLVGRAISTPCTFPIPGSRNPDHIGSNIEATQARLSEETLTRIDDLSPPGLAAGASLL